MHHKGAFSLHIFFPSGDPKGLRIVSKDNWSGRAWAIPRDRLDEAADREELHAAGVYVLRGTDSDTEGQDSVRVYVGESATLIRRLEQHAQTKEFWTDAVAFTRAGGSLDRADALYLEARLLELARKGGWCTLENGQEPDPEPMLEPDKEAAAEGYLEEAVPCLSALGFVEFEEPIDPLVVSNGEEEQDADSLDEPTVRVLTVTRNGVSIEAKGRRLGERGFEILKGSEALATAGPAFLKRREFKGYRRLREQVLTSDAVIREGEKYRFTKDVKLKSPSAAEAVVAGRSGSGLVRWQKSDEAESPGTPSSEPLA